MKIAVTGAKGQLGGELCRRLGSAAVPLARPEFDLTNDSSTRDALLAIRPDVVINCAAYTQVDRAEADAERCFEVNTRGVEWLVSACSELGCRLVQISSDYVFGADALRSTPYAEDDPIGPQGVYARSKAEGESIARRYDRHLIVRTCGLYSAPRGAPVRGRNFVDTMLSLAMERDQLRIVDDQRCAPSFVPHISDSILRLIDLGIVGTVHAVNSGETSWHGFATEIFRLAGKTMRLDRITTAEYAAPAPRPLYSVLSLAKFRAICAADMPPWKDGLAAYFRESSRI